MLDLRSKLSQSYILIILVCILLVEILVNIFLEQQFRNYVKTNLENQNQQFVKLISQQYQEPGQWSKTNIEDISISALEQGLILRITDKQETVIWDATLHNSGLCREMLAHMAENMRSRYPNWKGSYVETEYPLIKNSVTIGKVKIGYYGPFYFTDNDLAFINTLNQILLSVMVFTLLISFVISAMIARGISNPLTRVIQTAKQISRGNLKARSREKTDILEINQLIDSINDLAATLDQQETLRKRLTADVAHELRTPLATLQSHLEAMIDGIWQFDQERLKSIYEEIMRMNRMIKDLEKLAKYENEVLALQKTQINLAELVHQIIINFETEFENKGVKLNFVGGATTITADRDKMSQVIINLLSNALKFTPEGGLVKVEIKEEPNLVEMKVTDNGLGIPNEDLPHIFERFYRADKSRNRLKGGSGIGLTIAKTIVEAHQGEIRVQSKPGEFTEFKVILPK